MSQEDLKTLHTLLLRYKHDHLKEVAKKVYKKTNDPTAQSAKNVYFYSFNFLLKSLVSDINNHS